MGNVQFVKGSLLSLDGVVQLANQLYDKTIVGKPIDTIRFKPQPKQEKLLDVCGLLDWYYGVGPIQEPVCSLIGYGGAAYGAKTYGVLGLSAVAAYAFPGVQIAFFRRTYTEIEGAGGAMQTAYEVFNGIAESRDSGRNFVFPKNSQFFFQHCENEADVYKYEGKQFDILLLDEATHLSWFIADRLLIRNRVSGDNGILKPFCIMTTNPGNIGHNWYMQLFGLENFTQWDERDEPILVKNPNGRPVQTYFIPAFMKDNEIGMKRDPEYQKRLEQADPDLADALIKGDWSVFSGQAFRQFDPAIHICEPFDLPKHFPRWRAVDWGSAEPFCCLWFARDPDIGRVYVYREVYMAGLTDSQQAQLIVANSPFDENISITFADPKSFWVAKNRYGITYTSADEYRDQGVLLWEADNDRISGKKKIDQSLTLLPDGKPGLVIFRNCGNLIRTLPRLSRSLANPEDVDSRQEDHPYDTLRYGFTNPLMFSKREKKEKKGQSDNPWMHIDGL